MCGGWGVTKQSPDYDEVHHGAMTMRIKVCGSGIDPRQQSGDSGPQMSRQQGLLC